jgi:hypothetical protein
MVKFTICRRGHTAQSVAYLGHQRHNHAAKRLSKSVESGSRKGKGGRLRGHEFVLHLLFALVHGGAAEEADAVEEVRGVAAGRETATRSRSVQGGRTGWRTRADLPKSWNPRR